MTRLVVILMACAFGMAAANELQVSVYDGPKECEDAEKVQKGNQVKMHYTGTIDKSSKTGEAGKQFDSSRKSGKTFDFAIGGGQVIRGWDVGLMGLCKGAKAILVIPPDMGYGDRGAGGDIPGGATLNFDVEVVDVGTDAPEAPNIFNQIDEDKSGIISKAEVEAFFKKQDREVPEDLWSNEDKDKDGAISWEEFTGPKGDANPKDEL